MGGGSWDPGMYAAYSATVAGKSTSAIYRSYALDPGLDPRGFKVREARDSAEHPDSTPIATFLDVTGSMGTLAQYLAQTGLGILVEEILKRKPVAHPQFLVGAVGDECCDAAPLQATQFESDNRIVTQIEKIWVEGGGGGNSCEGYHLPWWFGGTRVAHDAFEKRGRKGYLFTVGDEPPPAVLRRDDLQRVFGDSVQADMPSAEVLAMASRLFHVFHIIIAEGNYPRMHGLDAVKQPWTELLDERAVILRDHKALANLVVSLVQVNEGADAASVASSWSGGTGAVVAEALRGLKGGLPAVGKRRGGIVTLS